MATTQTNHIDNLTPEEREALRQWLSEAQDHVHRNNSSELSKMLGFSTGMWATWTRPRTNRAPSQETLDWISERFDYPLPDEVRKLGAKSSHLSESVRKAQRRFREKHSRVTYGSPTVSVDHSLDYLAEDQPPRALSALAVPTATRAELADRIVSLVAELSDGIGLQEVEEWLQANATKLNAEERMRLVRNLML